MLILYIAFVCLLLTNPRPTSFRGHLYSRDTCLSPEGAPPELRFHCIKGQQAKMLVLKVPFIITSVRQKVHRTRKLCIVQEVF